MLTESIVEELARLEIDLIVTNRLRKMRSARNEGGAERDENSRANLCYHPHSRGADLSFRWRTHEPSFVGSRGARFISDVQHGHRHTDGTISRHCRGRLGQCKSWARDVDVDIPL